MSRALQPLIDLLTENGVYCPVRLCLFATGLFYHLGLVWMVTGQHVPLDVPLFDTYIKHMGTLAGLCGLYASARTYLKADAPSQP